MNEKESSSKGVFQRPVNVTGRFCRPLPAGAGGAGPRLAAPARDDADISPCAAKEIVNVLGEVVFDGHGTGLIVPVFAAWST